MEPQRDEAAKWAKAVNKTNREVQKKVVDILSINAARGWHAPTGAALGAILDVVREGKLTLVEANAKIYEDQRKTIYELDELDLKIAQILAKLAMELYRSRILNQVEIEQAEAAAQIDKWRAIVITMDANTERRTAALITMKADIEHEINIYKRQLIDAEYITLAAETALVNAKVATAEAKLRTIDYIYEVIAAEELVLAAEQRKAASLTKVLEAEKRIAEVKKTMIPYMEQKAQARLDLADATEREAEVKEALERLGYDRLALKDAQEDAENQLRDAELTMELAREQYARAATAAELARAEARKQIQEKQNAIRRQIDIIKEALAKAGIDLRIETNIERMRIHNRDQIELIEFELLEAAEKLEADLANLRLLGLDNCRTIRDSAHHIYKTSHFNLVARRISKGTAHIVDVGGMMEMLDACGQPPE